MIAYSDQAYSNQPNGHSLQHDHDVPVDVDQVWDRKSMQHHQPVCIQYNVY